MWRKNSVYQDFLSSPSKKCLDLCSCILLNTILSNQNKAIFPLFISQCWMLCHRIVLILCLQVPASLMGASLCPSRSTSNPAPYSRHGTAEDDHVLAPGSLYTRGRHGRSSWHLVSHWPCSSPVNGRPLSLCLSSVKIFPSNKNKINLKTNKQQQQK